MHRSDGLTAVGASPEETDRAPRTLDDELPVIRIEGRPPRWKAGPPRSFLWSLPARRRSELAQ
ncbi:hypothetical protein [Streptomyces sp. NBC_00154]|uniref:hypothetical protein n=1 Tax=Streptomyces sp. NBC_00154 TaxID=2975670 RepID=UPI002255AFBC|nr:hypothetical protein [Streptomyces sp. NBC_00154]MCX5315382.1 hypothetical protein [Streptomyces sp. NBC_00154]